MRIIDGRFIDGGWMVGLGILGMLLWLAIIVLAVVLIWRLLSSNNRQQQPPAPPLSGASAAEEVLRHRFASGEIDEEEYRRRLSILRGG